MTDVTDVTDVTDAQQKAQTSHDTAPLTVPLIEERVTIGIETVVTGRTRISRQVHTDMHQVELPLKSQRVEIERRAIGEMLPTMDLPPNRYEGETLVIPVVEEVLVTVTRLMLREEIRVTTIESVRTESRTVPLRRDDISIERIDP